MTCQWVPLLNRYTFSNAPKLWLLPPNPCKMSLNAVETSVALLLSTLLKDTSTVGVISYNDCTG